MSIRISREQAKALGIVTKPAACPRGMNRWEEKFAAELASWSVAIPDRPALIVSWGYEQIKLELARGCWYKPDFHAVKADDGSLWMYEVKGFMREAARVRIRVAAEKYRQFHFTIVRLVDRQWDYETVTP